MTLNVRPGLSAPLVNAIPEEWDKQWFRRWITDFLNTVQIGAGVSQIIAGAGIAVSPAGGTGVVTISVGSSGVITSVVGTANEIAVSTAGTVATLSFPQNVVIPIQSSGASLVVNSISGTGIQVTAPTGTANVLSNGGVIGISNNVNSGITIQSSGNQLELWMFEGSAWLQAAYWDTSRSMHLNYPMVWATNVWNLSSDGVNRIFFSPSSNTYFGTAAGTSWRFQNTGGSDVVVIDTSGNIAPDGTIIRQSNLSGWLNANYSSVETGVTAGCIYALGAPYIPNNGATNALNNLYGVGYTTSGTTNGNGTTITSSTGAGTGVWGFYVSSGGAARIFLDSDNGVAYAPGGFRAASGQISAGPGLTSLSGDISANRGGNGVIYLGTTINYLYFDGSQYQFGSSNRVNAGSFNATSDARLKSHIKRIGGALDKVASLRGVTFQWKSSGQRSAGLIAQDVESVLPEAVSESAVGANGEPSHKVLNYDATNGLLVEAIRELKARVEQLEAR